MKYYLRKSASVLILFIYALLIIALIVGGNLVINLFGQWYHDALKYFGFNVYQWLALIAYIIIIVCLLAVLEVIALVSK